MKNHFYEIIKRTFKKSLPTKYRFKNKVCRHQSFAKIGPTDLTWYSEFSFRLNGSYINVDCIHPRMTFKSELIFVMEQQEQLIDFSKIQDNYLLLKDQFYVRDKPRNSQNKNRSRLFTYRKLNTDGFILALQLAEDNLKKEIDLSIKPSFSIKWQMHGKSIFLCAPVELRYVEDVAALIIILKQILKHEISIEKAFNHYQYTRLNWFEEFQSNKME